MSGSMSGVKPMARNGATGGWATAFARMRLPSGRLARGSTLALGGLLLVIAVLVGSASGAYGISAGRLLAMLWDPASGAADQLVFFNIRLPRLVMGVAAGAGLGVAGALLQGLFRNPLADPGLIGVSSGAALAAGVAIVMGDAWFPQWPHTLGSWPLIGMAFGGGLLVTLMVYGLGRVQGSTRIGVMLLAGIAVNAMAGAGLGFLSFISSDEQLRNLQLWLLGSLGASRWSAVVLVASAVAVALCVAMRLARPLNAIALGEAQAHLLGIRVERTKRMAVMVTALAVGAVTATTGVIGFIGLIAPHWVRMVAGPDHRVVLPGSALLGAALVVLADAAARTVVKPAELPLGVLTAFIGVPLFLLMLRQFRSKV
ncbi:iron ABC transporter permease [Diaphorobacter ruginosibacter]|uniref:Iron ABC transporter permease n=1 Tax=Diaphorobacter ruginosibacter TaxID=1715720 RepID=A0A7G9RSD8_9BURK|nr:iron ABC transporter permease [Diaphorobacter ruginosibacter]QNN58513.1 iron ABC transporter permease [Diaphorobacter ruginosibacter]